MNERLAMNDVVARPSVILIREWEQQMSSSGCCGRLEGDLLLWRGERCFPERREAMEGAGVLYRAVRERFGDTVQVQVVDPRNLPALLPILLGEFWRYRVPARKALETLGSLSVNTAVVNGRIFSRGSWPPAERLCEEICREAERGYSRRRSTPTPPPGIDGARPRGVPPEAPASR